MKAADPYSKSAQSAAAAVPEVLTSGDLARRWQVSEPTIRKLRTSGELKAFSIGRQIRFRLEDVEDFEQRRARIGLN